VNRIKRPNTWLHRPMLQNVKKALANTEPSTHGTFRTSRDVRLESWNAHQSGHPLTTLNSWPASQAEHGWVQLTAPAEAALIRSGRSCMRAFQPDGQITSPLQLWRVKHPCRKYFCFSEIQIKLYDLPSRPERGALAIVTNVGAGSGGRGSARAQV
jgi:hypothetical protein